MGKFLIIIGVIMMVVGFGGTMIGTFSGISQIGSGVTDMLNNIENAEQYCNQGETLVTSEGATSYSPGLGYGRNVRYYCEDAQGNQREVTGEFVEGLFGDTSNIFSDVFGGISSGFPFIVLIMIGTLFLIIGVMTAIMRRVNNRPQMINPYSMSNFYPSNPPAPMGGQPVTPTYTQQPYGQQPYVQQQPYAQPQPSYTPPPQQPPAAPPPAANAPQDLATKLRQLEEARNSGLISLAEYQSTRQRILDEMKDMPS
jgi:hypothetical protein